MARWYATFDNSTVSALEAASSGNRRQRLAMTNGAALKTALLNARSALSAAMQAQMDVANRSGAAGVVVPVDGYTRAGGVLSWSNLYTNAAAVWPSDPKTRPTSQILVAGSSAVSPTDGGSISDTLYTTAQTAVQNVLAAIANVGGGSGGGPYSRLGTNPWRTLASLHHDHNMTYFTWDDFTPGQPGTITPTRPATQAAASALSITLPYSFQFPADTEGSVIISATLTRSGGGGATTLGPNLAVSYGAGSYTWTIPGGTLPAGTYALDYSVRFRDPNITAHTGASSSFTDATFVTLT